MQQRSQSGYGDRQKYQYLSAVLCERDCSGREYFQNRRNNWTEKGEWRRGRNNQKQQSNLQNNLRQNEQIDLLALMRLIKDKIVWILLSAIVFGGIGYAYSTFLLTPRYQASIHVFVNNNNNASVVINGSAVESSQRLIDTYGALIKGNVVVNQIIEDMDLDKSYAELSSQITVGSISGTQIMTITVEDSNQELACDLVKRIANTAVNQVIETVKAGSCRIVSDIYTSNSPVYPNVQKNALKAALLGAALCAGLFILRYLMDNTFQSEEDIENELDIPVLGVIPAIECCGGDSSKKRRKERSKS